MKQLINHYQTEIDKVTFRARALASSEHFAPKKGLTLLEQSALTKGSHSKHHLFKTCS